MNEPFSLDAESAGALSTSAYRLDDGLHPSVKDLERMGDALVDACRAFAGNAKARRRWRRMNMPNTQVNESHDRVWKAFGEGL